MLHDAARPNFTLKLLDKLINELRSNNCVIPCKEWRRINSKSYIK